MSNRTTEMIALQDRLRFAVLEKCFSDALAAREAGRFTMSTIVDLETKLTDELIRLFNFQATTSLSQHSGQAQVIVEPINARHILAPRQLKSLMDEQDMQAMGADLELALNSGEEGIIDLATGKVGGAFSRVNAHISIDVAALVNLGVSTAPQLTAILLHEVGHCISYFVYCANTASINQTLQAYVKENLSPRAYARTLKFKLLDGSAITQTDFDTLAKTDNRFIFTWRLSKLLYKHHAAHSNKSIYDNSSAEALADSFASRCGYGRALVEGLVALHKRGKSTTTDNVYTNNLSQSSYMLFKKVVNNNLGLPPVISEVVSAFVFIREVVPLTLSHVLASAGVTDRSRPDDLLRYDSLFQRVERVRQEVIAALRGDPNPKIMKMLLDELELIESAMPKKETWQSYGPVARWVDRWLDGGEREQISYEQGLARLLNNHMLVSAARGVLKLGRLK